MGIIANLLITGLAVFLTAKFLPGVEVSSYWSAIIEAAVIGILNAIVAPILQLLALPVTILTLGLFTFVIDAVIIQIASGLLDSFSVRNFWWALLFSIIVSCVTQLLYKIFG